MPFCSVLSPASRGGDRTLSNTNWSTTQPFKPTTRFTAIFPKVSGFVWVDEVCGELARIEGDVTEDISVGLFSGKKSIKGSHFMQERYEFLPGLWLISFSQYDFDGRKLFFELLRPRACLLFKLPLHRPAQRSSRSHPPGARAAPSWTSRFRAPPISENFSSWTVFKNV